MQLREYIRLPILIAFCVVFYFFVSGREVPFLKKSHDTNSDYTKNDVHIKVDDNTNLEATYFIPKAPRPPRGYPAIIYVHGFAGNKDEMVWGCTHFASKGYVTLAYSVRGQGCSDGFSSIMSTRERGDLVKIVNYVRNLSGVDTSSIAIIGGSQGGLHGLWAISDALPIKVVNSACIDPLWASDMLSNACIRTTVVSLLTQPKVRYDYIRDSLLALVRADAYDSLRVQFTKNRDLDTTIIHRSNVPLCTILLWQDYFFTPSDGIESYLRYHGPKMLYVGTHGHYSDDVRDETNYQFDATEYWTDHYLQKGRPEKAGVSAISYAYSSLPIDTLGFFTWKHVPATQWPPLQTQPRRFYLGPASHLNLQPMNRSGDSLILRNDYQNPNYTLDTMVADEFRAAKLDAAIPSQRLAFESEPLQNDLMWFGVPRMKLYVRSDYQKFPVHGQVYEVDQHGAEYFINRINCTARNWKPGSSGVIEVGGIAHAHRFTKGDRIRIVLTNVDKNDRKLRGFMPYVVPAFYTTSVTIFFDKSHPSYVELPVATNPEPTGQ